MYDREAQDTGHDYGKADASVQNEIDAITLDTHDALSNEVEDGAANRGAKQAVVEELMQWSRYPRACVVCAWPFHQLAHSAQVGKRISKHYKRRCHEQSYATGLRESAIDGQRRWSLQNALIDAQKPERREAEDVRTPRFEDDRNRFREYRKQEQKHEQDGNQKALQKQRESLKQPLSKSGNKHTLQSQNEGGCELAARRNG